MMEESSDESTEIITKEEAELAQRMQEVLEPGSSQSSVGSSQSSGVPKVSAVSPPAPLPSFLTSPGSTPASTQPAVVPPSSGLATPPQRTITPSSSRSSSVTSSLGSTGQASQTPSHQSSRESTPSAVTPVTSTAPSIPSTLPQVTPPGPVQTPHEASSMIEVPVSVDSPPTTITPPSRGMFGWISGSRIMNKMVEKTKSSVESVITTLDPGMKEVIKTGGDISVVVTSTKDNKLGAVREAFQLVFGKAIVRGMDSQATTAAQPVGFTAGLKGAEERIQNLRHSGKINDKQTVVSVEGFIAEMLPDRWYELSCVLLVDPVHRVELQTFSQPTPVPAEYILKAQDRTTLDYPLRWSGLAVSIGQVVEESIPHIGHADWQNALAGVSRRESLLLAAKSLAYMYQQRLPTSFIS